MLKKILLILSCTCMMNVCNAENIAAVAVNEDANTATYNSMVDAHGRVIFSSAWDKAYAAEGAALNAYEAALVATDKQLANSKYIEAIKNINIAVAAAPENAEFKLLGSQIYRHRGGLSYARNYFSEACELYEKQLKDYPESITLNLQYAIACYAGDARYYPDYNEYKVRAYLYANQTLKLLEQADNKYKEEQILLPKLLAYVILQDYTKAAKLAKRVKYICDKHSLDYTLAEEYEQLVANGQWLWRVSSKENAEKDFLLSSVTEWGI